MNLSNPIISVIPSVQGDVLGVLAMTNQPLSGRRVAGLLDGRAGVTRVSQVLRNLVADGLVLAEEHPPTVLYRLNRAHLAADSIIWLANLRGHIIDLIREQVSGWEIESRGAWIFGSFARGTADSASDIDVLLVHPDDANGDGAKWFEQIRALSQRVSAQTGNDCRIVQVSRDELTELFDTGARLARDLRREGIALTDHRLPTDRADKLASRGPRSTRHAPTSPTYPP